MEQNKKERTQERERKRAKEIVTPWHSSIRSQEKKKRFTLGSGERWTRSESLGVIDVSTV